MGFVRKTFDAVAWMRRRRTQIDDEDGSLTWEQNRQWPYELARRDPVLAHLCDETSAPPGAVVGRFVKSSKNWYLKKRIPARHIDTVEVSQRPTCLLFGDADRQMLFPTPCSALYRVQNLGQNVLTGRSGSHRVAPPYVQAPMGGASNR